MKRNIIIDCDPGHDDAIAFFVALANPKYFNILGITTVCGNSTLENTTRNALQLVEFFNEDIPVAAGYQDPLLRKVQTAAFVHGESGMAGPTLPEPKIKKDKYVLSFIL